MEEDPVKDVQLIPAHATINLVQETANGLLGTHGLNVLHHVVAELKIVQEMYYRLLQMAEKNAKESKPNSEIATYKNVQLIVSGVLGESGIFALGHAEVECREEAERYFNQKDMAASHVKEIHKKCKDVTWKHAQYAKIIQDMQDFVLRGQSFVLTVSSFRAAVKSHADYAKGTEIAAFE